MGYLIVYYMGLPPEWIKPVIQYFSLFYIIVKIFSTSFQAALKVLIHNLLIFNT